MILLGILAMLHQRLADGIFNISAAIIHVIAIPFLQKRIFSIVYAVIIFVMVTNIIYFFNDGGTASVFSLDAFLLGVFFSNRKKMSQIEQNA